MPKLDPATARYGTIEGKSYLMFDELRTGDTYAQLCVTLPSLSDPITQASKKAITDQEPTFTDDPTGLTRGYYVSVQQLHNAAKVPAVA